MIDKSQVVTTNVTMDQAIQKTLDEVETFNKYIRSRGGRHGVVDELKRRGCYTPEWIRLEEEKVREKRSQESARVRDFVTSVADASALAMMEGKQ